jgi:hypothetical protein
MRSHDMGRWLLMGMLAAGAVAGCSREPATPEAKRAKAEALLKTMSGSLAAAKAIEVDTVEVSDRLRTGGAKAETQSSRHITVRRPDGAYFKQTGEAVDNEVWYDGKHITLAMHKDKAWARGPMPATLDDALDAMATEYAIFVVAADLFYSNPYDSFEASASTGGWTGTEVIDGTTCQHLAFEAKLVNWDIWVADTPQALPCRMKVTYKQEAGSPTSMLTFRNWNLAPTLAADAFTAKIDPAYERLYLMRAPTAEPVETTADAGAAAPTPTTSPK